VTGIFDEIIVLPAQREIWQLSREPEINVYVLQNQLPEPVLFFGGQEKSDHLKAQTPKGFPN